MKKINHSISANLQCEFEIYNFAILEFVRNKGIRNHEKFPVTVTNRRKKHSDTTTITASYICTGKKNPFIQ
jgi:hypothetical protein